MPYVVLVALFYQFNRVKNPLQSPLARIGLQEIVFWFLRLNPLQDISNCISSLVDWPGPEADDASNYCVTVLQEASVPELGHTRLFNCDTSLLDHRGHPPSAHLTARPPIIDILGIIGMKQCVNAVPDSNLKSVWDLQWESQLCFRHICPVTLQGHSFFEKEGKD